MSEEIKKPFWVHCKKCSYEWVAFFTPIPVNIMKKFGIKHCVKCHKESVYTGKAPAELSDTFTCEKLS